MSQSERADLEGTEWARPGWRVESERGKKRLWGGARRGGAGPGWAGVRWNPPTDQSQLCC